MYKGASLYLADDRVIGSSDGVEDPLDAFERLLIASGDAVKSLVIVLQGTTALTGKDRTVSAVLIFPLKQFH